MIVFRWVDAFGYWHETDTRPENHSYWEIETKRGIEVRRTWMVIFPTYEEWIPQWEAAQKARRKRLKEMVAEVTLNRMARSTNA